MITATRISNCFNVALFIRRYAFAATPCAVNTARLLARAGYDVDVLCHETFDDPSRVRLAETNIRIHDLGKNEGDSEEDNIPEAILQRACAILADRTYVCFIGIEAHGLILAGRLAERLDVPTVYYSAELYYTGHPHLDPVRLARIKPLERKYHARSVATIVQDKERGRILFEDNRVRTEKVFCVPVGTIGDTIHDRGRYFHRRFNLPESQRILLQFGSIHPHRRSDRIAPVSAELPDGWTLVMHGHIDRRVHQEIVSMPDPSKIRLSRRLVDIDDLNEVVASADVGLVFYTDDNLNDYNTGLASDKMARHMQCGTPVITCDFPSFQRVIDRYQCGLTVADPAQIPRALAAIAADYDRFSRGAREAYAALYDYTKQFRPFLDYLYEISAPLPERKHAVIRAHAERYAPKIFIETGTFMGDTLAAVRDRFERLYSIELSDSLFRRAKARFAGDPNILLAHGDSARALPRLLAHIDRPCLFWLDGHFSGGVTAKGEKSTPVIEELEGILSHPVRGHVILIDDARDFNGTDDYPGLEALRELVDASPGHWRFEVREGIIAILPDSGNGPRSSVAPEIETPAEQRMTSESRVTTDVECILFSMDRAMQLDALLTSYEKKVRHRAPIHLLLRTSDQNHRQAYDRVIQRHSNLLASAVSQDKDGRPPFRSRLLALLDSVAAEKLFFLVDDIVFIEDTDLADFAGFDPLRFVPTLRLAPHLSRCYTLDCPQPLPPFRSDLVADKDKLCWMWAEGRFDWHYPLSVDGHLFATGEMRQMAQAIDFTSPNTFELGLQRFLGRFIRRFGVCYRKSKIVNLPLNRVQSDAANRHADIHQDALLSLFNQGLTIDLERLYGIQNSSAHQEIPVAFVPRSQVSPEASASAIIHPSDVEALHATRPGTAEADVATAPLATGSRGGPRRVAVIIPCYNQGRYLPEAVASVAAQTYRDLEVVIVNDGSNDNTSAVARELMARHPELAIRLIEQENRGLPAARNAGIAACRGDYWLPLDADDRIAATFIEKCLKALDSLPEAGFAYTDIQHFGDLDTVFRLPPFDAEAMVHRHNIGCVCSLVRRKAWEAVGGYDPTMTEGYEDWDFWVGCIEKGWSGVHIPGPLFFYRKRGGSMLTEARRHHDVLFARIVFNHPCLYRVEQLEAAARTIREDVAGRVETVQAPGAFDRGRKLAVTYLIHSILGVTGGNQTLVRHANALVARGHRVSIVTYSERPAWHDIRAEVIRVPTGEPMADHVPPSDAVIATYFLNARELVRVDAPVKVYFAQGDQYVFGDPLAIQDTADGEKKERMMRACAESYTLSGVRLLANSHHLAATVQRRYGRMADAILAPGVNRSVFRPLEKPAPPPWRVLVVGPDARGTAAEPLTFKGIGDIRKALDLLKKSDPAIHLVRMSNTPADIFKGYPCEFCFKPANRRKTEIYGKAHVLIYASHYDSCPLPPLEAMAAGAAVICTATAGAMEYCRHGENALLVPVASPEGIVDALRRLLADPELFHRLVEGGKKTAADFSTEREEDTLEDLLHRFTTVR